MIFLRITVFGRVKRVHSTSGCMSFREGFGGPNLSFTEIIDWGLGSGGVARVWFVLGGKLLSILAGTRVVYRLAEPFIVSTHCVISSRLLPEKPSHMFLLG